MYASRRSFIGFIGVALQLPISWTFLRLLMLSTPLTSWPLPLRYMLRAQPR